MWCWLQRIWPQACYCCSAWRWSAGAGTSPWDAPRDLPSPVQYSSLWRPEGEKKKKKKKISFKWRLWIHIEHSVSQYSRFAPTAFILLGRRCGSCARTQTCTLQGKVFPSKTCLLLQLALQYKHTHMCTTVSQFTSAPTPRWPIDNTKLRLNVKNRFFFFLCSAVHRFCKAFMNTQWKKHASSLGRMRHGSKDIDPVMFHSSHFSLQGAGGGVYHTQTLHLQTSSQMGSVQPTLEA